MSEYIYERPDAPAKVVRDGWNVSIEWDFVQREEIVRCRDCKHFFPHFTRNDPETPHFCELHGSDWVWPEGFCSGGERRDA